MDKQLINTGIKLREADEASLIRFCMAEMAQELDKLPELAAYIDDVDIYVCTRAQLIEAIRMVPEENVIIRQMLYMCFAFRQDLNLSTGRSFF